jgi:hypothetical protein
MDEEIDDFDLDNLVVEDDNESVYNLKNSPHLKRIRKQVKECLSSFFHDKKYWCGGPIPPEKIFREENIIAVMYTTVADALEIAHKCLEYQEPQSFIRGKEEEDEDIGIIICYERVLKICPKRFVPKCFAGGIILVYLALCQGVDYLDKLKEINTLLEGNYNSVI